MIRYDERGFGLSDWDVTDFSFEARLADLEAVVDAAGLDRFALLGDGAGRPGRDRVRRTGTRSGSPGWSCYGSYVGHARRRLRGACELEDDLHQDDRGRLGAAGGPVPAGLHRRC